MTLGRIGGQCRMQARIPYGVPLLYPAAGV